MNLIDAFRRSCMRIDSRPTGKESVLGTIAEIVAGSGLLPEYSSGDILSALREREKIGSTGFERGIAIPHCAVEQADEFVAGILIVPNGVDFQSVDGTPSTIFVFIVGPQTERNRHIQLLSAVSRMLSDETVAGEFRAAESEEALWQLLARHIGELDGVGVPPEAKPKNLFTIVVQREECFDDILGLFTAAVHGSLTVLESTNAGHYLHRMPLFASYWAEGEGRFNRVILALVDRDVSNDVIRRINTRVDGIATRPGVMIAVQELAYSNGLIEF